MFTLTLTDAAAIGNPDAQGFYRFAVDNRRLMSDD